MRIPFQPGEILPYLPNKKGTNQYKSWIIKTEQDCCEMPLVFMFKMFPDIFYGFEGLEFAGLGLISMRLTF